MSRWPRLAAAAAVAIVATAATGGTSATPTSLLSLPRATADRPDDVSGPQVHLVYVVPADGVDRGLDTNGVIAGTVSVWETWLAGQTGGRMLRLDTYQGADDITFVRLPQSNAELASAGVYVRDRIEADLKADGLIVPGKIYGVYYDGSGAPTCGGGALPPVLPGQVGGALPARDTARRAAVRQQPVPLARTGARLPRLRHAARACLDTLGFVPSCAPHFTLAGHVSDSPNDLMYAGPLPWNPTTLDVGHDDYFDAHIPGCLDLSNSPYLESVAAVSVTTFGSGTVTSNPPGIPCPTACTDLLPTPATLTASPSGGDVFKGWSGQCSGTGSCTLTSSGSVSPISSPRPIDDRSRYAYAPDGSPAASASQTATTPADPASR